MYDAKVAAYLQYKHCADSGHLLFAPNDGRCYHCGRNIYEPVKRKDGTETGITVEAAGKTVVTGCPHCNYSFCE